MYIRLTRSKRSKNPTVQIVESYRENGKVKQRTIASLGVMRSEEDRERLTRVGNALIQKMESLRPQQSSFFPKPEKSIPKDTQRDAAKVDPKNLLHVRTRTCGFEEVFGKLAQEVGFKGILSTIDTMSRTSYSIQQIVMMLITQRLAEPTSKRRTLYLYQQENDTPICELHQVYRAMDALGPFDEPIQKAAYDATVRIFNRKIELYFYDITTLYFESVKQDSIRDFGYSKDGKFNQVQILLGIAVDKDGIPVGYEIFSGKTAEIQTFEIAMRKMAIRFNNAPATIVCDRGMMKKANLAFIESSKHFKYIIGEKLRTLAVQYHQEIQNKEKYQVHDELLLREMPHPRIPNARLILGFSQSRAKKDKHDRERLLDKLKVRLQRKGPKTLITNSGIKKYVTVIGGQVQLNEATIERDAAWDGFFGITTNHPDLTPLDIASQYRGLWQVEATFRVAKHDLRTRPIYHWTEPRIRAHILICFMTLFLERTLYTKLKQNGSSLTTNQIHDALKRCQRITFYDPVTNRTFEMDSNKPADAKLIFKTMTIPFRQPTQEIPNLAQVHLP